uniref:Ionotropic glutamate receptor L-glutamate and glycine-binding domain-containing protein n=1 Tax=Magallana gigas TaxID=29159 RepID=A0A8W8MCP3_MAGGI
MWDEQKYSKYVIVITCFILFHHAKENNVSECESKHIGIVYSKLQEVNLDEIQNNRCIIYFVDFSEPYLVLQKVHEMSKKDYDFIFFPSNIPTFIQDFARYFTSKTIITEQTSHCLPSVNNPEATALDVISDGRRIVKENRSQFQLQKVASMSIAIFKELRWRLSVIFFDNLYALLVDVFSERINQDYLASAFDQSKGNFRFTALRDHSSWFVVTTSPDFDDDIGTNNSILDNVILLNVIEKEFEPVVNVKNCTTRNSDANIFFLYTLLWKTKLDRSPRCNLYRKFEPIGCVDSNGLLTYSSFFPNSNFGFNRRHLFVTTIWWPPFTERFIENGTTVKYFGYCMDLLRELAKALNFTYTVIEAPDGEFGTLLQNGSWSGMVGQLERRVV